MVIGICGKSGSGKSLICCELEKMGAFVINADAIGKEIMTGEVLSRVEDVFPDCFENGVLNRRMLGSVVFNDCKKLELLNKITHPAIICEVQKRIDSVIGEYNYIVVDAAVMIEAGMLFMFDFTVAVIADDNVRTARITERDGIPQDAALSRIAAQNPDKFYIDNTDFYVSNNGDLSLKEIAYQIIERSKMYETKHS